MEGFPLPSETSMSNIEQRDRKDERDEKDETRAQSDAGVERAHVERQPVPGHPENIPTDSDMRQAANDDPTSGPVAGPVQNQAAPSAEPATKPGTPPGTQSERDRLRGSS
jgi:hypothetical protein